MLPRKRYDTNAESYKFCAYRKAWDLLLFGYGRETFNPDGLTAAEADEVWEQAKRDIR